MGRSGRLAAAVAFIIVILVAAPQAQQPTSFTGSPGAITAGPAASAPDATNIDLLVGRSTILNVGAAISRVSLTVPDIADAMVTTPQQLLIHGKTPGTISLFVWDRAGGIKTYEVNVRRDLSQLVEQVQHLFPGEGISVSGSGKEVVLAGTVSSKYVVDKAAEVAGGYVEKPEYVVNLLKQQEGVASNQVLLRVRFAEVSRSAMQELGASLIMNQFKSGLWDARSTTQQFAAPDFDSSQPTQLNFSDYLNLFLFNSKNGIGAVVRALQSKGLFESLAEPNLIALNGKEASFLAGGEYPYPVVQPGGSSNSVTIQFKEFGVRLHFTPTILNGDLINLQVEPEVSTLDFTNAVTLDGFRVPALSTRKTKTEVELQDGQTFAIAGLLNNTTNSTMDKIPGIGDIPVLGYLFKSKAYQKNQTELVVMITPQILRRNSVGVSEGLPNLDEPFMNLPKKTYPSPAPYVGSPVAPATRKPGGRGSDDQDQPAAAPQGASQQPAAPSRQSTPASQQPTPALQLPTAAQPMASQPQPPVAAAIVVPHPAAPAQAQAMAPQPLTSGDAAPEKVDPKAAKKAAEAQKAADRKAAADQAAADKAQAAADRKAAQEKAIADKKAAEEKAAADKKAAEDKAVADKKAADDKARQDKLDAERAKREADVAKKVAEEQKKHDKAVADADAKLKAAQDQMAKNKGIQ